MLECRGALDPAFFSAKLKEPRLQLILVLGLALGTGLGVQYLPGGYDAFHFYLRSPFPDTTAPYWVYLLTYPLSLPGWPLSWQVLSFLSVLAVGATALAWGNRRWWIAMFSAPMMWNLWLGQIELFPVLGLLLAGLVLQKKLHPAWLGVAWLALACKPQVGAGLILFFAWWVAKEQGYKALIYASAAAASVLAITLVLWPGWPFDWAEALKSFRPTWWNAAVWPYGLLAWPLALLPVRAGAARRLRLVAAACLLGSPYFALYHCLTLLVLCQNPAYWLLSWLLPLLGSDAPGGWMTWGWVLPAGIIVAEYAGLLPFRQAARQSLPPG